MSLLKACMHLCGWCSQGDLVYANYGEEKDFRLLADKGVSCQDKIVIMRIGQIFLGHMVRHVSQKTSLSRMHRIINCACYYGC